MKNIKEIVCENLIYLRKSHNMTQIDLAKRINYSDKAISRWEKGEVAPDYEVLQSICDVFNVPIGYLFEEHLNQDEIKEQVKQNANKIAVFILYMCFSWTIVTIAYVYFKTICNINFWQLFVWGVPITCIIGLIGNAKYLKNQPVYITFQTILVWSTLAGIYLQNLKSNFWPVFFIGIPAQATIIVASYIKKSKNKF